MTSQRFCLAIIAFVLGLALATPVYAAPAQTLSYELYAGGLHALGAQIKLEEGEGRYKIELSSGTSSGLRLVAPWSGTFATAGWLVDGTRVPETYDSLSKTSKIKTKSIVYDRSGNLVSYKAAENDKDKTPDPLDRSLAPQGIVDVLTATLKTIDRLNAGKGCDGSSMIFDGDRSFSLSFKDAGTQQIDAGKYNIYSGPAQACSFEMTPEKGKWKKKLRGWLMLQDQAKSKGAEPIVYFARLNGEGAYVPVRFQISTNYGMLLLHLTGAQTAAPVPPVAPKKPN